jgi:hypothetical protein
VTKPVVGEKPANALGIFVKFRRDRESARKQPHAFTFASTPRIPDGFTISTTIRRMKA